jgi:hypothetical protein
MRRRELDSFGSGYEQVVGRCKYGNALTISTKFREFLDYPKNLSASQERLSSID